MSDSSTASGERLSAPHTIEYAYRRSLGSVLSAFFTGLRDRQIKGIATSAGKIVVPPSEYDPSTGAALSGDLVDVGPGGVVKSWTWIPEPRKQHLLDHPFAYALIQLDGADTALLHAVDAGDESSMSTGMRVTARWADETQGHIHDITSFVPEAS